MPRAGTIEQRSPDEPEDFGAFVRLLRLKHGISQSELGREINYSQRVISDVERGKIAPSQSFQDAIAKFKKIR